ncbi:Carboxymuconolactone decarboxylase [Penicillium soppii]|jgi:alkylhydroperoxidase family enzyme|uniref:Carboxymuconolactone decarboxylase n=1 Tax=Penicillium soppii TaxID=69789 RepID=UPI002548C9D9|nr:Carboxymuconolactone decarboxylase [Penicillium soppii]KAJ5881609.1 Carboxymuconolactone decarboxylase [Penicillium soppii]
MRLPYVQDPPPTSSPDEARILADIQARREPNPLLPLDLALLHSFPIAEGWNSFFGAIRAQTTLSAIHRELAICRVAVVNGALFEWEQHAPLLQKSGMNDDILEIIKDPEADFADNCFSSALSPEERIVLRYTDAMTKTIKVPDEVFADLKTFFNPQQVLEITTTIAGYNCVSRILVALDIGEKNHGAERWLKERNHCL